MRYILFFCVIACFHLRISGQDLCYSQQASVCQRGFVGDIEGQPLFFEIWTSYGPAGTAYNSILLKTDTANHSDSFDFCFEHETGKLVYFVFLNEDDLVSRFPALDANLIPSVFQVLVPVVYGYQDLHEFNTTEAKSSIFIKDNKLFIEYMSYPRYDKPVLEQFVYVLENEKFRLLVSESKITEE